MQDRVKGIVFKMETSIRPVEIVTLVVFAIAVGTGLFSILLIAQAMLVDFMKGVTGEKRFAYVFASRGRQIRVILFGMGVFAALLVLSIVLMASQSRENGALQKRAGAQSLPASQSVV